MRPQRLKPLLPVPATARLKPCPDNRFNRVMQQPLTTTHHSRLTTHFLIPACQFSTTVSGVVEVSRGSRFKRKRWPSAVTSY